LKHLKTPSDDTIENNRIIVVSPFETPDVPLTLAFSKAGALGVLDVGRDLQKGIKAIAELPTNTSLDYGIRIPENLNLKPSQIPQQTTLVILTPDEDLKSWSSQFPVLVQVTSVEEARIALDTGIVGLIAKGNESGGRVGQDSTFILLQRLLELTQKHNVPVWAQGGICFHTAAGAIAGGASGVVLDNQVALLNECRISTEIRDIIRSMDGTETKVIGGYRVFTRPDLPINSITDLDAQEVQNRLGMGDLKEQFLPLGQNGALASLFFEYASTAKDLVYVLHQAIAGQIHQAKTLQPLAPNSPLAQKHHTRYPIVQGPMTRVSDTAAFAKAVALDGGLPLLALSLMKPAQARQLMEQTKEQLGDQAWGVGILGFAPPDIRNAHFELIKELAPPFVLIAGGRPTQARALEKEGIQTYLHVPSPSLLQTFLKEGARNFVFEGRECGGHVGPRSSFVLWEQQINILLDFENPAELCVLFAGGIHDDRSAAIVSALAAPLAARGVKIGVLMGTAYLMTKEAVESGAILDYFQKVAIEQEETTLVETAPGHATRCLKTPFVDFFEAEKKRLIAEGKTQKEIWALLEMLNVGRLRIASKGIIREDDELIKVDQDVQAQEGMFMIGDVCALHQQITTIAQLHHEISVGATQWLDDTTTPELFRHQDRSIDIAIIGMACIYPGSPDLDGYWSTIVHGKNTITEVPLTRWNPQFYYDPSVYEPNNKAKAGEKTPCKTGGFLDDIFFEPLKFGFPPNSLAAIEPAQLLSLEAVHSALVDAGYEHRYFDRERTSVIFGTNSGTDLAGSYGFRNLYPYYLGDIPPELDAILPKLTEDSFPGVLANVVAGRIANRLDFRGVNYTVDAACASSLASIDLAIKELAAGTSDLVFAGGVDTHNSINDYLMFASVYALSTKGESRPFDSEGDGIVLGEGVGVVVLKRLEDAERDGDRIYAVIKSVAGSSDGKCKGLTAPRKEGQTLAMRRAYQRAGVSPLEVGLVEAHGTGTVVGDRTELKTMTEVYNQAGATPATCRVGSVKSQIGHTKCAAGIGGLIKTTLALYNRVLPPTINIKTPNPFYHPEGSPFVLEATARPWLQSKRAAAVSAFGFGGTNFHAVISSYNDEPVQSGLKQWSAELFVFRGQDRNEARELIDKLAAQLVTDIPLRLRDFAYTTAISGSGAVQVAFVALDIDDLKRKLEQARQFKADSETIFVAQENVPTDRLAFLFPGQGSQRVGMFSELFTLFPTFQELLRQGESWSNILYPPTVYTEKQHKAQTKAITETRAAQVTLGMVEMALYRFLEKVGVVPDMLAGHSYGELVALTAAGVLKPDNLLNLSQARGESILKAIGDEPGTMAAVNSDAETVRTLLETIEGIVIANENSPIQTVISGSTSAIEAALSKLNETDLTVRKIKVACAFHSPLISRAQDYFAEVLAPISVQAPQRSVYSNTTAQPYPTQADAIKKRLAEHLVKPVQFSKQIKAMYDAGARIFVEVGPGQILTRSVQQILGDQPHTCIAIDKKEQTNLPGLLKALAKLSVLGVQIDLSPLFEGREAKALDLNAPVPKLSKAVWQVNGHRAIPLYGQEPAHAMKVLTQPLNLQIGSTPSENRETAIMTYLQNFRELAQAQRDVMLGYLGQTSLIQPIAAPIASSTPSTQQESLPPPAIEESQPSQQTASLDTGDLQKILLQIVAERTGYPLEMLDLNLDLEADLSIDSIKRIEILNILSEKVDLERHLDTDSEESEELLEELVSKRTLQEMIDWLEAQIKAQQENQSSEQRPKDTSTEESVEIVPFSRYVLKAVPANAVSESLSIDHKTFLITDDTLGIAQRVIERLKEKKAEVHLVNIHDTETLIREKVDGFIHLGTLAPTAKVTDIVDYFSIIRPMIVNGGLTYLLVAGAQGEHFSPTSKESYSDINLIHHGGGMPGFIKTVAHEFSKIKAVSVALNMNEQPDKLADYIVSELLGDDSSTAEVAYLADQRYRFEVKEQKLAGVDTETSIAPLQLSANDVVLFTGGARGITAQCALAFAQRYRCHIVLLGRSPQPHADGSPEIAAAQDLPALRKILIEINPRFRPAQIEAECTKILANREIIQTFNEIKATGSRVDYYSVDVRDKEALGNVINQIAEQHGPIKGILHGAGIVEDKLIRQKTPESFERVLTTKVVGALNLIDKMPPTVDFVVFFSSVVGAFGNRGQVDYATANDALDKLSKLLNNKIKGRVVSINWGPWVAGMVSAELQREYTRRGIGLIVPAEGVKALMDELSLGDKDETQVIWMAGSPDSLKNS